MIWMLVPPGRRTLSCRPPPHAPHPRHSHPPPLLLHLLAHSPFPPVQLLVDACATPARSPADCRAPRAGADPPLPTARAPAQRAVCDRSAPLQARPRHPSAPSHACPAASAHPPPGECRLAVGELVCPRNVGQRAAAGGGEDEGVDEGVDVVGEQGAVRRRGAPLAGTADSSPVETPSGSPTTSCGRV